jgi:hypothetical protein
MNPKHSEKPGPANHSDPESGPNPAVPELPDFIIIPRIPGLPPEVTGGALRAALQIRARTGVTIHRL